MGVNDEIIFKNSLNNLNFGINRHTSKSISIGHKNTFQRDFQNYKVGHIDFFPVMTPKPDSNNDSTCDVNVDSLISTSDYRNDTFQSIYYQQDNLPEVKSLPYGLLECDDEDNDMTSRRVLEDALCYINGKKKTWIHDFTALTNIQIAINEDSSSLTDWEFIFPIIQFVSENIKNIRSTVAKNAILTAHVIGIKANDPNSKIKIQLLPSLFSASVCEKSVIRQPANDALNDFSRSCRKWSDSPYLWALCLFSRDRNARICAVAAKAINLFIKSLDKDQLQEIEINQLSQYLNLGLGGKLADTRHHFVDTVEYILDNKNIYEIRKWLLTLSLGTPLYSLVSLRDKKPSTTCSSDCEFVGGMNGLKRRSLSSFLNKSRVNIKPMERSLDGTPSPIIHTSDPKIGTEEIEKKLRLKDYEFDSEYESSNWCCDNRLLGSRDSCFLPFSRILK